MLLGLVAVVGHLDAAGLAPPADQHLRLDHTGKAQLLGGIDGLLDGLCGAALGHRNTVLGEQLLALVFEQVHERPGTL